MKRRVVVTGLGIVSPVGSSVPDAWDNVVNGRSGIRPITHFDASKFPTRFSGAVSGFNPEQYIHRKELRHMDPFAQYGIAAADQALKDSGLEIGPTNAHLIGVSLGSGCGGYLQDTPQKLSPFFLLGVTLNMCAAHVSMRHGLLGPSICAASACATGTHSIGFAARVIERGDAVAMVAGSSEFATTPLGLHSFCQLRALSKRNDNPSAASRPWDKDRDGIVMADGAGAMVLEEYEHAKARGAVIYAELVGFGMSSDAYHVTMPHPEGVGASMAMLTALGDAGMNPEDVDYINAHATSTDLGDVVETAAIKKVFGSHARKLSVSSTKSTTGHLLAAAGAVEAIFTVLALRDGVAPPTINLDAPGEGCDLDYVPHFARQMPLRVAMSNSFGFGGTNGSLIFKS